MKLFRNKQGNIIVPTFETFVELKEGAVRPDYYLIALESNVDEGELQAEYVGNVTIESDGVIPVAMYVLSFDRTGEEIEYEPNWKDTVSKHVLGIPMQAAIKTIEMNMKPVTEEDDPDGRVAESIWDAWREHMYMQDAEHNWIGIFHNPDSKSEYWLDDKPAPPMEIGLN